MNGLSALALCAPRFEAICKGGYRYDESLGRDEYVSIQCGTKFACSEKMTQELYDFLKPILAPTTIDVIREHIGRLALLKKIGQASEATMPMIMGSMAFELAEYSQLAILQAFREIKRDPSPWMPTIGEIIKKTEECQEVIDKWCSTLSETKQLTQTARALLRDNTGG